MSDDKQEAKSVAPAEPLAFIRRLAGPGLVIAGYRLIPVSFGLGVGLACIGFLVCLAEVVWEPLVLRLPYQLQVALVGLVFFSWAVFLHAVLAPVPIAFQTLMAPMDYADGTVRGGITWRPPYTELELIVTNPTDGNFDDLDLVVKPDFPVAGIGQLSNLSDVSFENYLGQSGLIEIKPKDAKQAGVPAGVPLVLLTTDAGYRVHCGRIPPERTLTIIMAVVAVRSDPKKPDPNDPAARAAASRPESYFLGAVMTSGETYWYGNPGNLSLYGPRPRVKRVAVRGSFTAAGKRRTIEPRSLAVESSMMGLPD